MTHATSHRSLVAHRFTLSAIAAGALIGATAHAMVPGINGDGSSGASATTASAAATSTFNLAASPINVSMPDGAQIYSWAYGCGTAPGGAAPGAAPALAVPAGFSVPASLSATPTCGVGQLPGPTLIVTEGQTVTVNLYNGLPVVAGNTSIVFSGMTVTTPTTSVTGTKAVSATTTLATSPATYSDANTLSTGYVDGGVTDATTAAPVTYTFTAGIYSITGNVGESVVISGTTPTTTTTALNPGTMGLVTREAAPGTTVTYSFVASKPGTYAYYSGTRPELQVEMGLYGAVVVLPKAPVAGAACSSSNPTLRGVSNGAVGGTDFRLSTSAYDHASTCYDREFLFQFHEMDSNIHQAVQDAVGAGAAQINVVTDPFHPNYFMINGRSFPDDEDPNYSPLYANQPYNGNPQIHPGETMLLRVIGQGRWQHPFHIHANHGRVVARDGNLLVSATDATALAGPLYYTVPTVSGQAQDLLFTYTAKGLNWDIYGHNLNQNPPLPTGPTTPATVNGVVNNNPANDPTPCYPDTNGFFTINSTPVAAAPGAPNYYEWCADHNKPIPITPPDPQIVANGLWYGGTPYLGLTSIPVGGGAPQFLSTPLPPGTNIQNPTAGYAFMWHSHAERELTTNDVFPGGMLMMMIVQPPVAAIDETL